MALPSHTRASVKGAGAGGSTSNSAWSPVRIVLPVVGAASRASVEGGRADDFAAEDRRFPSGVMPVMPVGMVGVGDGGPAVLPGAATACRASLEGSRGSRASDAVAEDTVGVGGFAVVPVVSSTCRASVEGSRVDDAVAEDSRVGEGDEGEGDGELVDDTVALSELEEDAWDMRGACLPLKNLPGCLPLGIRTAESCCSHRQQTGDDEPSQRRRALARGRSPHCN